MTHATIGTHPRGISDESITISRSIPTIAAIVIVLAISVVGGMIGGAISGAIGRIGDRGGEGEIKIGSLLAPSAHSTAHLDHEHAHATQHDLELAHVA